MARNSSDTEEASPTTNGQEGSQDSMEINASTLFAQIDAAKAGKELPCTEAIKWKRKKVKEVAKLMDDASLSPDSKLAALHGKHVASLIADGFASAKSAELSKRDVLRLTTERDTALADVRRVSAMRDKLQELCRELQKRNKAVAAESRDAAAAEQSRCAALSAKFNDTVSDITSRLEAQSTEHDKLRAENESLRDKLKALLESVDAREEYMKQTLVTHDLQSKLAEAKLAQQEEMMKQATSKLELYKERCTQLEAVEGAMKEQVAHYTSKFEDFQNMITSSNEVFTQLKGRLAESKKKEETLEATALALQKELKESYEQKLTASQKLLAQHEAIAKLSAQTEKLTRQKDALEGLCRGLQAQLKGATAPAAPATPQGDAAQVASSAADVASSTACAAEPSAAADTAAGDPRPPTWPAASQTELYRAIVSRGDVGGGTVRLYQSIVSAARGQ